MARRRDIIGCVDCTGTTFQVGAVNVTDVATAIPTSILANRKAISVFNYSDVNKVFLGNSDVTTATGYPLTPYQGLPFDMSSGAALYGICETGKTADVRVIQVDNS